MRVRVVATVIAAVVLPSHSATDTKPVDSGLKERVETTLALFEVRVERDGQPVRGLGARDFEVTIDGRSWPIAYVDAYCPEPPPLRPAPVETAGTAPPPVASPVTIESPAPVRPPRHFVIFFDFHDMTLRGRLRGIDAAANWVRTVRRPGEITSVYAYGAERVLPLCPPTDSSSRLLAAIESTRANPELIDTFPESRDRKTCCEERPPPPRDRCKCYQWALEEWDHAAPSFSVLEQLLLEIGADPAPKELLFFNEILNLNPWAVYRVSDETPHESITKLEDISSAATASRTRIDTIYVGSNMAFGNWNSWNFGHNAADLTGGTYNRRWLDADAVLARAGRDLCSYVVAIRPPPASKHVRWVRLKAPGDVTPSLVYARFGQR